MLNGVPCTTNVYALIEERKCNVSIAVHSGGPLPFNPSDPDPEHGGKTFMVWICLTRSGSIIIVVISLRICGFLSFLLVCFHPVIMSGSQGKHG